MNWKEESVIPSKVATFTLRLKSNKRVQLAKMHLDWLFKSAFSALGTSITQEDRLFGLTASNRQAMNAQSDLYLLPVEQPQKVFRDDRGWR